MKEQAIDQTQEGLSHQDVLELLQRGRAMHDRAVFEFLGGVTGRIISLARKHLFASVRFSEVKYHDHSGLHHNN
ncbi:MAG: hypothetical protein GWN55_04470 [Phycisphaerae bacterium]|nr:hypothetical protein [Gammaproteobacteria bacterium]NIR48406.1 hypothetical protein [candidate division KSB1 bacterium]NIV00572.1 hypothetical protein [Phycisphaerae bacterium]NIS23952.1 hypothetical protein [candidate division KSB1 bacterium]NIU24602.1 hypothetical protein [candidate division KSB1 bacterium]